MESRWSALLQTHADFILQPANCLTTKPRGVSKAIGKTCPHARIYHHRQAVHGKDLAIPDHRATPGTAFICESKTGPGVITIFNDYRPGAIGSREFETYCALDSKISETPAWRLTWFISALDQVGSYFERESKGRPLVIATPCEIGHQYWEHYEDALWKFEHKYGGRVSFIIY